MPTGRRGRSPSERRCSCRSGAAPSRPWPASSIRFEDALAGFALALMVVLPLAEIVLRRVAGTGIPGSIPFVQHLVLWVGFLGAALAAREGTMLALATGTFLPPGRPRDWAGTLAATVAAAVSMMLCVGAVPAGDERARGRHRHRGGHHDLDGANGAAGRLRTDRAAHGVAPAATWAARAIAACGPVAGGWLVWDSTASRRACSGRWSR